MRPRTSHRPGFSLVELIVALLVVGVLVGLAMPRFNTYRRKAHVASMVSDLRNLAAAEEEFWNAMKSYSGDTTALELATSPSVTLALVSADSTGWSARAIYAGDPATCSIFYGSAAPLPPAARGNVIGCSE